MENTIITFRIVHKWHHDIVGDAQGFCDNILHKKGVKRGQNFRVVYWRRDVIYGLPLSCVLRPSATTAMRSFEAEGPTSISHMSVAPLMKQVNQTQGLIHHHLTHYKFKDDWTKLSSTRKTLTRTWTNWI